MVYGLSNSLCDDPPIFRCGKAGTGMRARVALAVSGLLAWPAAALAAGAETAVYANSYSVMLERQLLNWRIWTTGVSRLDDGALFGLASVVLGMAFASSGLGVVLFREKGLGFRAGWLVALPSLIAAMIGYCSFRPYPTMSDMPSMLLSAMVFSLVALLILRMAKGALGLETPVAANAAQSNALDDRRLKLAVRPAQSDARR